MKDRLVAFRDADDSHSIASSSARLRADKIKLEEELRELRKQLSEAPARTAGDRESLMTALTDLAAGQGVRGEGNGNGERVSH